MATNWLRRTRDDGCEASCCPECEEEVNETLTYCTSCGYDIVQQARIDLTQRPPVV
jgi:hypothetical protein